MEEINTKKELLELFFNKIKNYILMYLFLIKLNCFINFIVF